MSFRATITEEYTEMNGDVVDKLAGLACYIETLIKNDIPEILIKKAIDIAFEENKEEKAVETILDNDNFKIQKFNLNNLTKEESIKVINKELKKMFD